ncbi:hypothetical protein PN419_04675 [Halorubrum ezzemoulense]|jgi:hypothetical protein|uniref:Uncharacterized protein n=1 Tax=Halorubrum ezzemoulense TaxID=337243 RepID=A0A256J2R8_HALEZ|nr:hypothetical protein [Halorubrum ezzemoulense]MDB2236551.1 hypothetical protein [Halorubrum ezzemoulense]MDB2248161.1 hypothetical protein [Halorubrum ezzemoulense]MDB2259679.1 hypothetical protein [Halorubrum ezzemoulense]MDB2266498.1 hypothetical protein [Halorubrum ezzemoulense]MDB2273559.1 hypothetical protein [Halorubrum ezzemoulense]
MSQPSDARVDELLSAARTATGDELRSLTYFTHDDIDQLYLRSDLSQTADLVGFAENERQGFHAQSMYADTQLGDYRFTVRVFENGYLTRVIANDHGVWATTDSMEIDRFEELASALAAILRSFDPA